MQLGHIVNANDLELNFTSKATFSIKPQLHNNILLH